MKACPILVAAVVAAAHAPVHAAKPHDYPTHEVVRYVHECMVDRGGQSWSTLYNCSCKFDVVASNLDYDAFVAADTAKRGRRLAGERGGVLRETEMAEELREDFEEIEEQAERACFIGPSPGEQGD